MRTLLAGLEDGSMSLLAVGDDSDATVSPATRRISLLAAYTPRTS